MLRQSDLWQFVICVTIVGSIIWRERTERNQGKLGTGKNASAEMTESEVPQRNATDDANPTADNEQPIRAILPTAAPEWNAEEKEHRRKEKRFWNWYLGLTAATAIGAGISILFAVKAYDASLSAVREARRQADAAETANRPFVLVTGLKIDSQNVGMPYWGFRIIAQNSGNTATRKMHYVAIGPTRTPLLGDPDIYYQHPVSGFEKWNITLPPHFDGTLSYGLASVPVSSFKQAVSEHAWYFVYGAVHYEDSSSKEHVTRFCFQVGAYIADVNQPGYQPCGAWNCADEDCDEDQRRH